MAGSTGHQTDPSAANCEFRQPQLGVVVEIAAVHGRLTELTPPAKAGPCADGFAFRKQLAKIWNEAAAVEALPLRWEIVTLAAPVGKPMPAMHGEYPRVSVR